jgi:hypothetical protein
VLTSRFYSFTSKIPPPTPAEKKISKKSAEFQKHVQFFHLPAIGIEDLDFSMPIQPLSRLSLHGDKMADRFSFKCHPLVTVTKPRAATSKTGVLLPPHQGKSATLIL